MHESISLKYEPFKVCAFMSKAFGLFHLYNCWLIARYSGTKLALLSQQS